MDETYIKVIGIWKYLLKYQNRGSDLDLGIHMTYGKILITGPSGHSGRVLRTGLSGKYQLLCLLDITPLCQAETGEELVQADIRDMAALEKAMERIDCVVHLAGIPVEGPCETVCDLNIDGCYNAYEAAPPGCKERHLRELQSRGGLLQA
jgi:nucleoside-diphosphate-sugar epimerase